ncbi:OmpA family protein [Balneicella halophila]|uniref:OmpA family protein n=1 Tax=Balneicella halophila TaxID=1537566 RepID=A0A7L4USP7_BALHA|nr:OmpA family protein [Balneicella halophila]PVX52552.1 OmpA family protein [Balneicella halophila]
MKRTVYLLSILLVILIGTYLQYCYCCKSDVEQEEILINYENKSLATFSVEAGDFKVESDDNFDFDKSSYKIRKPVSASVKESIEQLRRYLVEDVNRVLKIRGYYAAFEENTSIFPNLGLARANAVKNYLRGEGINKKQLRVDDSQLTESLPDSVTIIKGATAFELDLEDENALLERIKSLRIFGEELQEEPIHLYFKTGEAHIHLSVKEREQIRKISEYLTQVDEAKLLIVGHTDNTGNREMNIKLSKERADFVKDYFIKNDFSTDAIETRGVGPDKPIATNNTEEGRAKNRRVTLVLK